MGAETDEIKARTIRFAINQDEIRPDMAVAVIGPFATERMVEIPSRQRVIICQYRDGFQQRRIEVPTVPSGFLAAVIALKAASVPNIPHSSPQSAPQASRRL